MLITFEGIDGSGKTTLIKNLVEKLEEEMLFPIVLREPGGTKVGEAIRDILKSNPSLDPVSRFLLFSAARRELTFKYRVLFQKTNCLMILDRYVDSSYVYQSVEGVPMQLLMNVSDNVSVLPDMTFLVDVEPETALKRLEAQRDKEDNQNLEFLIKIREAYRQRALLEPERWRIVNGNLTANEVLENTYEYLRETILKHFGI